MTKPNGWTGEVGEVADEPVVEVSGTTVKHNAVKWRTAKNRHSNTDGTDWGWIEGAPGNVCWSNNSKFNRASAEKMAGIHNQWLEDQKPLSIKLIEARERRAGAAGRFDHAKSNFEDASAELARCDAALASLLPQGGDA
jgi:hypothetical protein